MYYSPIRKMYLDSTSNALNMPQKKKQLSVVSVYYHTVICVQIKLVLLLYFAAGLIVHMSMFLVNL